MKEKSNENKDRKEQLVDACYSESARDKWFCYAFKSGFFQLICKAFLVLKSNLDLALSIIF